MNKYLCTVLLPLAVIVCLAGASAVTAEESATTAVDAVFQPDEAREEQTCLRPLLEPSFIPSQAYLESCRAHPNFAAYSGKETPDELKALAVTHQKDYEKIVTALPKTLAVHVAHTRHILVLTYRTGGLFHGGGAAGLLILLREAAKKYGAFTLTERYAPDGIDAKFLSGFDAVVLNNISFTFRSGLFGVNWGDKTPEGMEHTNRIVNEENTVYDQLMNKLLPDYVKQGGGIFATHGVVILNLSESDTPNELTTLLGGVVDSTTHPKGDYSGGLFVDYPEPDNPLVAAFHKESHLVGVSSELYSLWLPLPCVKDSRVLLSLDTEKMPGVTVSPKSVARSKTFASAIIWIKSYGKGRVYFTVIGHDEQIHEAPCVAGTYLDGILYATGDLKVPDRPVSTPAAQP